jgi:hypothetical protein
LPKIRLWDIPAALEYYNSDCWFYAKSEIVLISVPKNFEAFKFKKVICTDLDTGEIYSCYTLRSLVYYFLDFCSAALFLFGAFYWSEFLYREKHIPCPEWHSRKFIDPKNIEKLNKFCNGNCKKVILNDNGFIIHLWPDHPLDKLKQDIGASFSSKIDGDWSVVSGKF